MPHFTCGFNAHLYDRGFIRRVGTMAANARASTLREMALDPAHSYAAALVPTVR